MDQQYTVRTAMRWIVQRESWTIFEREKVLNGMLADLAVGEAQARKQVRLALSSGAGRQFSGMLRKNDGTLTPHDLLAFRTGLRDCGFGEDFVNEIVSIFLYAVSLEGVDAGQARTAPPEVKQQDDGERFVREAYRQAGDYIDQGQNERAIALLETVIARFPGEYGAYNLLGVACHNLHRTLEALLHYERALNACPGHANMLGNKAYALMNCGRIREAVDTYQAVMPRIRDGFPDAYALHLRNYGLALARDGQNERALDKFRESTNLGDGEAAKILRTLKDGGHVNPVKLPPLPDDPDGVLGDLNRLMASVERSKGQNDYLGAILLLDRGIRVHPDVYQLYNEQGIAYRLSNRNEEALVSYDMALSLCPNNANLMCNRAVVMMQCGRAGEAVAAFRKALPILKGCDPEKYTTHLANYTLALAKDGKYDLSVAAWQLVKKRGYKSAAALRIMLEAEGVKFNTL